MGWNNAINAYSSSYLLLKSSGGACISRTVIHEQSGTFLSQLTDKVSDRAFLHHQTLENRSARRNGLCKLFHQIHLIHWKNTLPRNKSNILNISLNRHKNLPLGLKNHLTKNSSYKKINQVIKTFFFLNYDSFAVEELSW